MGLTVAEKEHFKTRIDARVKELESQLFAVDSTWERDLQKKAVQHVESHFGINPDMAELSKLRDEFDRIQEKIAEKEREIVAKMRGLELADVSPTRTSYYRPGNDVFMRYPGDSAKIMQEHVEHVFRRFRRAHPIGERLDKLEDMRMEFHDAITTAGTHAQLAAVWNNVKEKLEIFESDDARQLRKVSTKRTRSSKEPTTVNSTADSA